VGRPLLAAFLVDLLKKPHRDVVGDSLEPHCVWMQFCSELSIITYVSPLDAEGNCYGDRKALNSVRTIAFIFVLAFVQVDKMFYIVRVLV
jgi:hypothetical protein